MTFTPWLADSSHIMAPIYFAKILVFYPKRLKISNVHYYKSVKAMFSAPTVCDIILYPPLKSYVVKRP